MKFHVLSTCFLIVLSTFGGVKARGGHGKGGGPGVLTRNCRLTLRQAACVRDGIVPIIPCMSPNIGCLNRVLRPDPPIPANVEALKLAWQIVHNAL